MTKKKVDAYLQIMNVINLFTRAYSILHNYPGMPYWVLTPFRRIVRHGANKVLPWYLAKTHERTGKREDGVIVSFTSFPTRINDVWQVVECMMRQSFKPSKILLWLSEEQFPTVDSIPQSLRDREGEVFEIRMVEGDIRSHKKYYYVAKEYPKSLIFLIDDDIYYPTNIIERTMKVYSEYPDSVICNYGYHILHNNKGELLPYNSWPREFNHSKSKDIFLGSGGGTLFRPCELHDELTNIAKARELAPIADDVWLNCIMRLSNKEIILLDNGLVLPIANINNVTLASDNKGHSQNDIQLQKVKSYLSKFGADL